MRTSPPPALHLSLLICFWFFIVFVMADRALRDGDDLGEQLPRREVDAEDSDGDDLVHEADDKWTELVGLTAEEAEKKIKEDMPEATVQVVPPGHFVTMDFVTSRVRLNVDSSGKVSTTPRVG